MAVHREVWGSGQSHEPILQTELAPNGIAPEAKRLLVCISHEVRQHICSAGLLAGCRVGLPVHAGPRSLRHDVHKQYRWTSFCSGGKDAASTADQEVGATGGTEVLDGYRQGGRLLRPLPHPPTRGSEEDNAEGVGNSL